MEGVELVLLLTLKYSFKLSLIKFDIAGLSHMILKLHIAKITNQFSRGR